MGNRQGNRGAEGERPFILMTKLHTPKSHAAFVNRPHLNKKLDACLHCQLTLVSAPAGFGKTTLAANWVRTLQDVDSNTPERAFAWVSLDQNDNDPVRFLIYFITGLQQVEAHLGETALAWLESAAESPIESVLAEVINDLAEYQQEIVFIFDDFHLITEPLIHDAITFLLDNQPSNLHLIIITRTEPPWSLARLRVRRQLHEIRAQDLRFSGAETAAFLKASLQQSLAPDDIDALAHYTEGWAAALQLAALSLENSPATASVHLRAFDGRHGHIFDYLVEEVLQQQSPAVQKFLAETAVLNRLNAPLCAAVLGTATPPQQAQQMLEQLHDANLFLIPLDEQRQWFRYHHLFADFLRHRLRRLTPERLPQLHQRAADWYARNGYLDEAIHHALAGQLYELAADLIAQTNEALFQRGELALLFRRLAALPPAVIHSRLDLCLNYAWVLTLTGRYDETESLLQTAESRLEQQTETLPPTAQHSVQGNIANIRAYVAYAHGDMPTTRSQALVARDALPQALTDQRTVAALHLGTAHLEEGNLAEAEAALQEALHISQQSDYPYLTLRAYNGLAWLYIVQDALPQAAAIYQQALYLVERYAQRGQRLLADAIYWGLCRIHYAWNELETAESYLVRARETVVMATQIHWHPHILQMQLHQARGNIQAAAASLARAEAEALQAQTPLGQITLLAWQAWWQQRYGDIAVAVRAIDTAETLLQQPANHTAAFRHLQELVATVQAEVLIHTGAPAEAIEQISQLRQTAVQFGRAGAVIHTHLLQALGHHALGEASLAQTHFAQAIQLAEPGGNVRLFLDADAAVGELLRATTASTPFLEKLNSAVASDERPADTVPRQPKLTPREHETLRLLATDRTIPEIAEALVVSVSTVRTYCKRIYRKLDVHSRAEAVYRAQSLHLLK